MDISRLIVWKGECMKKKTKSRKKTVRNKVGKLLALIQLLLSFICVLLIGISGLLPMKYMLLIVLVAFLMFEVPYLLQYAKGKASVVGIVISVLICICSLVGIYTISKVTGLMSTIGGAEYKTDNMIVVVRKEDPAEIIQDAKNYQFGIQSTLDKENTSKMCKEMKKELGAALNTKEYSGIVEEAQALLSGELDAAVYNSAFNSLIEGSIEGYSDKIKVIYQYGIKTKLEPVKEKTVEDAFNIYISGIDVEGSVSTTSRSDVNIIMTVNPDTHKILLTTTPRDYYVPIPDISGGMPDKLTHAGLYGVDASMRTLEAIYDIDLSYYARVNFTSLIKIVDALGGVDVYSDYAFTANAGGYSFQEGMNHMNGEQALAFSRERYSFSDGDNQRGKNQEAVITAILKKAMSPAILKNAGTIISDVSDSVETNMTQKEMSKFISMQLSSGASWDIQSASTQGILAGEYQLCFSSGSQPLSVMYPDENSIAENSKRMKQILEGN